jgi:hypothetical protein
MQIRSTRGSPTAGVMEPAHDPDISRKLAARVAAAEAALRWQNYVSAIDLLVGLGWLAPQAVDRWRQGQVEYLERVVVANLKRMSEAMKQFRSWAAAKGLLARETGYVARRQRRPLRFSESGEPAIERRVRTHRVSPELSPLKRRRRDRHVRWIQDKHFVDDIGPVAHEPFGDNPALVRCGRG